MYTVIRPWTLSDFKELAAVINNPHILNNLRDGLPYPYTERDAAEFISSVLDADKSSLFAFTISRNGHCAGSITVTRNVNVHRLTGELGYYVAEPCWGLGLATRAVSEICDFVFTNSDIIRIYAEPFAYNSASCRVLEKCGFSCEGVLRNNVIKNGKIYDTMLYARLKAQDKTF